jgi:hypothetical protein
MGSIATVGSNHACAQMGSLACIAPQFDVIYVWEAEKLVVDEYFVPLGAGWYEFRAAPMVFHAPGWKHGYSADDAARTPLMCRRK